MDPRGPTASKCQVVKSELFTGKPEGPKWKTNRTVVGVDTAKRVFQLHWIDMETGEIVDLKLTRAKFLEHFANRAPCLVAMEACGGHTALGASDPGSSTTRSGCCRRRQFDPL